MARPLRFRFDPHPWDEDRVRSRLLSSLDSNIGATMRRPWYRPPDGYDARRFEMDNGDIALFCWTDAAAYWVGNTETPSALWQTDKRTFDEAPDAVSEWAQRELLAQLHQEDPWLADYPRLSWFFLPVFLSKDGRRSTRSFFADHAGGFPETDRETALEFYERLLASVPLDEHRYVMASKLGTSEAVDRTRMSAALAEFHAAKLLDDAGYDVTPEIEVSTGHSIDFRADRPGGEGVLVEVTRPLPPARRAANSAVSAIRDTAETKTGGQLAEHAGGVVLFVDCSSFSDDDWAAIARERPEVHHRPAVVYRMRPDGGFEGYTRGSVPLDLPGAIATPA